MFLLPFLKDRRENYRSHTEKKKIFMTCFCHDIHYLNAFKSEMTCYLSAKSLVSDSAAEKANLRFNDSAICPKHNNNKKNINPVFPPNLWRMTRRVVDCTFTQQTEHFFFFFFQNIPCAAKCILATRLVPYSVANETKLLATPLPLWSWSWDTDGKQDIDLVFGAPPPRQQLVILP